jgi:hypothetical protein
MDSGTHPPIPVRRWWSHLRAAVVAGFVAALVAAPALVLVYQSRPAIRLGMDRALPGAAQGFYPLERQGKTGFAWSGGRATLSFDRLDRRGAWRCRAEVINWRPPSAGPATVRVRSDGVVVLDRRVEEPTATLEFGVPPDASRSAFDIAIDVSPTFRPGPKDQRELGLAFDELVCAPAEGFSPWPSRDVLERGVASAAVAGVIVGLTGLPALAAAGIGGGLALAQSWSLASGGGALSVARPPLTVLLCLFGAFTLVPLLASASLSRRPLTTAARLAIVVSACGFYLKLAFLLHPDKDIVDAVFHGHRFDWVLAGRFYFTQLSTSATPFPYAVGLYVFSAPWSFVTQDHVTLLRIVVCASEAVAGALLYPLVARTWGDRAAGALAVLLFQLLPLPYAVIGNANLTNAFGQSAALVTMIAAMFWRFEPSLGAAWLGLTALAALAFLSHVGTLAFLLPTLTVLAALYYLSGPGGFRRRAVPVFTAGLVAFALAVGLYYAHFGSVYRPHIEQARAAILSLSHTDAEAPRPAGQSPTGEPARRPPLELGVKGAWDQTRGSLGWPIIILAMAGAVRLAQRRKVDPLVLGLSAWLVSCAIFLGWSIVRTVEPRYVQDAWEFIGRVELATSPAAAVLAAAGAVSIWRMGRPLRVVSAALVCGAAWVAARALAAWIL